MKRCPKHPDTIQAHDKCEVWVGPPTLRCGHTLDPLPAEELREMQIADLKETLDKTTLPDWVVTGIRQWAWDIGHSCGQAEVDGYMQEWLYRFEELQKNVS